MSFDSLLGPPSPKISVHKVRHVGRVDGPEVALAVWAATALDKAFIQTQVVADAVLPPGAFYSEVQVVFCNPLVDLTKN